MLWFTSDMIFTIDSFINSHEVNIIFKTIFVIYSLEK